MVFDGEELLEFAIKSIRNEVDFVSITYQTTSYFGNPSDPNLPILVKNLKSQGLIDEIIHFEPDLSIHHKINELNLRNIGLEASRKAGCSHHISADVDEFYKANELKYAKEMMYQGDYDFSIAYQEVYYKDPTFLVYPNQNLLTTFIHPVSNEYSDEVKYPDFSFHCETTRRFKKHSKYKIFNKDEIIIHHMSYVRKSIEKKLNNSDNGQFYKKDKFFEQFHKYNIGDRVCLIPDFINRKTKKVENTFNIYL